MFLKPDEWGFPANTRPWVIAGPCGAESEEQVLETALGLKEQGVHALRAGIWKPRTRPGSFEGMGEQALVWVKKASIASGLPVTVEVASPKHVEQALKAGIDFLWLGARTTVNPFLVQEIADSLKGVDIPVMIKNPVNPDLELWIGAIERFQRTGNNKIAAIHRGFSSYENQTYRNKPNWELPIELRRRLPGITLFCDPSHICGNTFMLEYVAQFALDLQYDGLMIESHRNPKEAMSDAAQQLTPGELGVLLSSLQVRKPSIDDPFELSRLEDLRDQIDEIDSELLNLMAQRMNVARTIGKYKFLNNLTILQPERWEEIVASRVKSGIDKELTKEFILKLYGLIHEESMFHQTNQMIQEKKDKSTKDSSASK
ncbi:MAG TPA: chorismate mutase [Bacteroidia bacterium]|jgi:chorismate mutase|nr:chorismate mutase [Bacteroidia bacterium]HQF29346.1 chorismate mutase [Bacteroidia bacterium]